MPVTTAMPGIGNISTTEGFAGSVVSTTITRPWTLESLTASRSAVVVPTNSTLLPTAAVCQMLDGRPDSRFRR